MKPHPALSNAHQTSYFCERCSILFHVANDPNVIEVEARWVNDDTIYGPTMPVYHIVDEVGAITPEAWKKLDPKKR